MIHRHIFATAVIVTAVLCSYAQGEEPTFLAHTIDGKQVQGKWNTLQNWLDIRQKGVHFPAPPNDSQLILTNGNRIAIEPTKLKLIGESLTIPHSAFNEQANAKAPLSSVGVLWLQNPAGQQLSNKLLRQLLSKKRTHDELALVNGDQLKGILIGIDENNFKLDSDGKTVLVDRRKTAYLAFTTEGAANEQSKRHYHATLNDGSKITLNSLTVKDATLFAKTPFSAKVQVPLSHVIRVQRFDQSVQYLSEMKPTEYQHQAYLSISWPLVTDGSVAGGLLHHIDGVYDNGLGMHSASRVSYAVPSDAKTFETKVALDSLTGKQGSVRISVLLDDKKTDIGFAKELTVKTDSIPIRLDVSKAKKLTLFVDFGTGGPVGDHVNWLDARFINK